MPHTLGRIATPPPQKSAKKSQQIGRTNRQTDFSAKQVPSALDLSPRPKTHLPIGCSVVGVMWKPKISLNFQKNFHLQRTQPPPPPPAQPMMVEDGEASGRMANDGACGRQCFADNGKGDRYGTSTGCPSIIHKEHTSCCRVVGL